MKLTVVILLAACLHIQAKGFAQTVTVNVRDVPLVKVFDEIERQTSYSFVYTSNLLQAAKTVTLQVTNSPVEEVLRRCLKEQPFTYKIINTVIIINTKPLVSKKTGTTETNVINALPALLPVDITGKVTDKDGNPLVGASVIVKRTGKGTETDINGLCTLKDVNADDEIVISFIGYKAQTLKVGARTNFSLALEASDNKLDEIQIEAYRTNIKRVSTSNIGTVKAADIQKQPVNNPLLALQGRVPGLFITQNTGIPGGGITVRLQGQNSLNRGSDPLYVIDGVPYIAQLLPNLSSPLGILGLNGNTNPFAQGGGGNPLTFINPADIESIDILKDADATAIYGSRAANGAILITTKKGKAGHTKIDFNFQNGWGKVTHMSDLLNTQQYLEMRHEAKSNDGATILPSDYDINGTWDTARYTDWQKELIGGTSHYIDAQASVSGGNSGIQFLAGAGYHRETTVFPGNLADQKGSLHLNLTHSSPNQRFRFEADAKYLVDNNRLINTDLSLTAIRIAPDAPALYKADGSLNWASLPNGNSSWFNPLAHLYRKYRYNTNNLIGNVLISYRIVPGLELRSSFGYTNLQTNETSINPLIAVAPERRPATARLARFGNSYINSWIIEPQLTYKRGVSKGTLEVLLGTTLLQQNSKGYQLTGRDYNNDQVMEDIKSAATLSVDQSIAAVYRYNALFARINYNWESKYIINLTGRRDGSSRFGPENLFHNFGSVAGAWLFSNESFMQKKLAVISFGKLRASYGTTGNDQIGEYQFMNLYNPYAVAAAYQGATALAPASLPNPYLQWEETRKLQFGLDLGFFKDRLLLNANYYRNRSSNLLQGYALPILTGFPDIQINFPATIQNTGWEFTINTRNFEGKDFSWSSNINLTVPANKLIAFPNLETSSFASVYVIGQPVTIVKVFHLVGVDPATGLYRFTDKGGNPITPLPNISTDRTTLVNTEPKFYGGFQNNFRYKGFELDVLFQFTKKTAANYLLGTGPGVFFSDNIFGMLANQPVDVLGRWRKPGDIADFQKFPGAFSSPAYTRHVYATLSDRSLSDASYIRLKNLSLSWQLPEAWRQKVHLQYVRIYVQAQNLLTITDYKGRDPEQPNVIFLPPLRVMTLGLQVGL